jgi:hypothetical protein
MKRVYLLGLILLLPTSIAFADTTVVFPSAATGTTVVGATNSASGGTTISGMQAATGGDALLLEDGSSYLLLESGDKILKE